MFKNYGKFRMKYQENSEKMDKWIKISTSEVEKFDVEFFFYEC
jgi:hypothetical protein